jgi:transposase-like protein
MSKNLSDELIVELFKSGKSCKEIGSLLNCNPETIRLRLKKHDIDTSKKSCDIKCLYCGGKCRKEGKTIYQKQRYLCLECNKIFSLDVIDNRENMLKRHDEIKKMYLVDNLSTSEIGKILGVNSTVPQRILKKYGLTRTVDIAINTKVANKLNLTYDEYILKLPVYKKYRRKVINITNKQPIESLSNYEKRGLAGVEGAYHLDHKYSILEGFKNDISPEIIGNINNLEYITWEDNLSKKEKCSITKEELLKIYYERKIN